MGEVTRRDVMFGTAACAIALAIPSIMATAAPMLILYGDGIHDDTKAFSALGNGEKVFSKTENRVVGMNDKREIFLPTGTFYVPGSVVSKSHVMFVGAPSEIRVTPLRVPYSGRHALSDPSSMEGFK